MDPTSPREGALHVLLLASSPPRCTVKSSAGSVSIIKISNTRNKSRDFGDFVSDGIHGSTQKSAAWRRPPLRRTWAADGGGSGSTGPGGAPNATCREPSAPRHLRRF